MTEEFLSLLAAAIAEKGSLFKGLKVKTSEEYKALLENGGFDPDTMYLVWDEGGEFVSTKVLVKGELVAEFNADTKQDKLEFAGNYDAEINKVATEQTVAERSSTLEEIAKNAEAIAKGANQALSFGNYQILVTSMNALPKGALRVGQNVYVVTVGVPDLWVSDVLEESVEYAYATDEDIVAALESNGYVQVGHYKLAMLEGQKVDLTEYVKNAVKQYQGGGATRIYGVNRQGEQVMLLGADIASAIHTGRFAMYLTDAGHDVNKEPNGALVTKTPIKAYQSANKNYVDNLPDYLTLTDDSIDESGNVVEGTRTKWLKMLGIQTETWTFTLEDGTTVEKKVVCL